jgi:hypothetical protein
MTKRNNLEKTLEKAAKIIQAQLAALSPDVRVKKIKELEKLASKV